MNLLLDTHVFLWAIDNSPRLSPQARAAITDGNNLVFVSAATAWEIAIKRGIGKLTTPSDDYLDELRSRQKITSRFVGVEARYIVPLQGKLFLDKP